jgi:hypothetical protein
MGWSIALRLNVGRVRVEYELAVWPSKLNVLVVVADVEGWLAEDGDLFRLWLMRRESTARPLQELAETEMAEGITAPNRTKSFSARDGQLNRAAVALD